MADETCPTCGGRPCLGVIVAQWGKDAKNQHHLVLGPEIKRPNIYTYAGEPPLEPVELVIVPIPKEANDG